MMNGMMGGMWLWTIIGGLIVVASSSSSNC